MTTSQEKIKDWIRAGYEKNAQHMFIVKDGITFNVRPYWVKSGENVAMIRTVLKESGDNIIDELNMDVKLLIISNLK